MIFTIEEIKHYLSSKDSLEQAIDGLTDQAIVESVPVTDVDSLNFKKTEDNLLKYETIIGMKKEKDHQRALYRSSGGKKGKQWMALSPKWIGGMEIDTKYQIAYWVNYGDGDTYGWFTVEQIREWLNDPELQLHQLGGTKER